MELPKSKSSDSGTATEMLEGGIRALVRGNRPSKAPEQVAEDPFEGALLAGATSISDIETLMMELQVARDYLQSEGERVRRETARYAHLAQTASASVKIIAESMGRWRKLEMTSEALAAMPLSHAPALSPDHLSGPDCDEQEQQSDPSRSG